MHSKGFTLHAISWLVTTIRTRSQADQMLVHAALLSDFAVLHRNIVLQTAQVT